MAGAELLLQLVESFRERSYQVLSGPWAVRPLRARGAAEPAEVAFDFAVEIVGDVAVAIRLAHIAAEPGSGGPARRAAELRDHSNTS